MNTNLASKKDLRELEVSFSSNFKNIHSEMKQLELRMVIKLGAIMLAGIGIMQYLNGSP